MHSLPAVNLFSFSGSIHYHVTFNEIKDITLIKGQPKRDNFAYV